MPNWGKWLILVLKPIIKNYQGGWSIPDADVHTKFTGDARTGEGHYEPNTQVVASKITHDAGDYILSYYTKTPGSVTVGGSGVQHFADQSIN